MESKSHTPGLFVSEEHAQMLVRITQKIMLSTFGCTVTHINTIFVEEPFPLADVSGFVTISQEQMNGTLAFLFPMPTLHALLAQVYRTPPSNPEKSAAAAVGEICNMVFGMMKTEVNGSGKGFSVKMALPNVVVGHQHQVLTFLQGETFVASFDSNFGPFQMGVTSSNG